MSTNESSNFNVNRTTYLNIVGAQIEIGQFKELNSGRKTQNENEA